MLSFFFIFLTFRYGFRQAAANCISPELNLQWFLQDNWIDGHQVSIQQHGLQVSICYCHVFPMNWSLLNWQGLKRIQNSPMDQTMLLLCLHSNHQHLSMMTTWRISGKTLVWRATKVNVWTPHPQLRQTSLSPHSPQQDWCPKTWMLQVSILSYLLT